MAVVLDLLNSDPRKEDEERPRHPEKAHKPDQPIARKPAWIRVKAPGSPGWAETNDIVGANKLVTVCEEAACPNIGECWEQETRHVNDHGRHLHPRLRLLQRQDRHSRAAEAAEPENIGEATAELASRTSSSPRWIATTSRRWRRAFRRLIGPSAGERPPPPSKC